MYYCELYLVFTRNHCVTFTVLHDLSTHGQAGTTFIVAISFAMAALIPSRARHTTTDNHNTSTKNDLQ